MAKDDNNNKKYKESIYSNIVPAGKKRTYFFDVRETRGNDYFITMTESTRRQDGNGYNRHKLFLYKEDFNKFIKNLEDTIDYVKKELIPEFDYDKYSNDSYYEEDDEDSSDDSGKTVEATSESEDDSVESDEEISDESEVIEETEESEEIEEPEEIEESDETEEEADESDENEDDTGFDDLDEDLSW